MPQREQIAFKRWGGRLVKTLALVMVIGGHVAMAGPCGPGPGWVSQCSPGINMLQTTTVLDVIVNTPQGPVHFTDLMLSGPTATEIGTPGLTDDGLAFVDVGISRHLSTTLPLGITVVVDTLGKGKVIEQSPGSTMADSFFDVFFDLTINGQALQSTEVHGVADRGITRLPLNLPQGTKPSLLDCGINQSAAVSVAFCLVLPGQPVSILDSQGRPVVIINSARLDILATPEPATLSLMGFALMGLTACATRRRRSHGRK